MSIPHTGKIKAIIKDMPCEFDGDAWVTPDNDLSGRLNEATISSPKTHFSIYELAEHVLSKTGLLQSSKILSVSQDKWNGLIPEDAED